jgi:transketolase
MNSAQKQNLEIFSNTLKGLALDIITNAKSGHPGICLGMSDILTYLYQNILRFNPKKPNWHFRDRIVWSAGHGSAAVYSSLFLSGYELSLDDLKQFRKIHSITPGHPEYGITSGVEATTGPLGQGIANAVGMAMAYKILSARFEKLRTEGKIESNLVNYFNNVKVYCIVGDGCLMEGISQEAISFAARYNLTNLVTIFDNNSITIDGETDISTIENHEKRFAALGFNVLKVDGHNIDQIESAFQEISLGEDKMHFISAKTVIGRGSVNAGTSKAHGNPLSEDELLLFKQSFNLSKTKFDISEFAFSSWRQFCERNLSYYEESLKAQDEIFSEFDYFFEEKSVILGLEEIAKRLSDFKLNTLDNLVKISTRKFSQKVLEFFTAHKGCIFGTADLTESVCFSFKNSKTVGCRELDYAGSNLVSLTGNFINYGIREHGMGAIMNGLALSGFLPFGGTFLCFSDYMRPAIRLSALMQARVFYVFSHDSIFLGEDGPTHQAIEHFGSLCLIPDLAVFRPCDQLEVIECYQLGIAMLLKHKPCAMILSRQDIEIVDRNINTSDIGTENLSAQGLYQISSYAKSLNVDRFYEYKRSLSKKSKIIIIANGSEVSLVCAAVRYGIENLHQDFGCFDIKIVAAPALLLFEKQSEVYQESVLEFNNEDAVRFCVFAGNGEIFRKYLKHTDVLLDVKGFGFSAKYEQILAECQFDAERLAKRFISFFAKL